MTVFQQTTKDYKDKPGMVSMTLLLRHDYHRLLRQEAEDSDVSMAHIIRKIIKAHCERR